MTTAPHSAAALPRPSAFAWLVVGLGAYYLLHFALRLWLSTSLEPDDADLALFSQSLEWGYSEQPPLYSWIVWAVVKILGVGVVAITLVKTGCLLALHAALYAAGRELLTDRRLAALVAASPLLITTYTWNSVAYLTHTVLACVAAVALVAALARFRRTGHWADGVLVGVVVGLGLLTKYNFVLAAAALITAALCVRSYRERLLSIGGGLALLTASLLLLPHLAWLGDHAGLVHDNLAGKTGLHEPMNWAGAGRAAGQLTGNLVLSLLPMAVCVFLVLSGGRPVLTHHGLWLGLYALVVLVELLGLIALGTSRFHERWLQPVLALAPLVMFAFVDARRLSVVRLRWYTGGLVALAIGLLGVRTGQVWLGGSDRGVYPLQMAFEEPKRHLAEVGFAGATLVCHDRELAGNLRVCFPSARVLCSTHRNYLPPACPGEGRCFLVWNAVYGVLPPQPLADYARTVLPEGVPSGYVKLVEIPPGRPGQRVNQLAYWELCRPAPRSLAALRVRP